MTDPRRPPMSDGLEERLREVANLVASHGATADPEANEFFLAADAVIQQAHGEADAWRERLRALARAGASLLPLSTMESLQVLIDRFGRRDHAERSAAIAEAPALLGTAEQELEREARRSASALRALLAHGGDLLSPEVRGGTLTALWKAESAPNGQERWEALGRLGELARDGASWAESWREAVAERARSVPPDVLERIGTLRGRESASEVTRMLRELRRANTAPGGAARARAAEALTRLESALAAARNGSNTRPTLGPAADAAARTLSALRRGETSPVAAEAWTTALENLVTTALPESAVEERLSQATLEQERSALSADPDLVEAALQLETALTRHATRLPLRRIIETRRAIDGALGGSGSASATELRAAEHALGAATEALAARRHEEASAGRDALLASLDALAKLDDSRIRRAVATLRTQLASAPPEEIPALHARASEAIQPLLPVVAARAAQALARSRAATPPPTGSAPLQEALRSGDLDATCRTLAELEAQIGPAPRTSVPLWSWLAGASLPAVALVAMLLLRGGGEEPASVVLALSSAPDTEIQLSLVGSSGTTVDVSIAPGTTEATVDLPPGRYTALAGDRFTGVTFSVPGVDRVDVTFDSKSFSSGDSR